TIPRGDADGRPLECNRFRTHVALHLSNVQEGADVLPKIEDIFPFLPIVRADRLGEIDVDRVVFSGGPWNQAAIIAAKDVGECELVSRGSELVEERRIE